MHILFLTQFYSTPDCPAAARHYAFLRHLGQRHDVSLVTTRALLDAAETGCFDLVPSGVHLHAVDTVYQNHMGALQRVRPYVRYAAGSLARSLRLPPPDVVFASNTPLSVAVAGAAVARARRAPLVLEVQDLWPDFPVQMGAIRSPLLRRALYGLERRLYRSAAHVVATSPDMEAHVRRHGVPASRTDTLLYGTDIDLADDPTFDVSGTLRETSGIGDAHVLLYAGSFGRANDIPTLIETARLLRHRADLVFVFMGQGYHAAALQEAVASLPNVRLLPPQPRHRTFSWFRLATLSVVSFIDLPVLSANSPAKFFDSLAAGTPVIVTNPGWTKQFVEAHRCGWYVPPSRPEHLAHQIVEAVASPDDMREAGKRGSEAAHRLFDRRVMAPRFEDILLDAMRSSRG